MILISHSFLYYVLFVVDHFQLSGKGCSYVFVSETKCLDNVCSLFFPSSSLFISFLFFCFLSKYRFRLLLPVFLLPIFSSLLFSLLILLLSPHYHISIFSSFLASFLPGSFLASTPSASLSFFLLCSQSWEIVITIETN